MMPTTRALRYILFLSWLVAVSWTSTALGQGTDYYASPDGTPGGDGSFERPWNLATALAHPAAVRPGDTIWLRGGTYRGTFTSRLTGATNAPIIVRQYPGERATIDGGSSRLSPPCH